MEFKSQLEDILPAIELDFEPTPAFGKYKPFLDHAIAHPAKMNTNLLEYLILNFTKENDIILDPMAGTFSTCIVAILNKRNSVSVELEEKFVNWGREAVKKTEQIIEEVQEELKKNPPLEGWCECED